MAAVTHFHAAALVNLPALALPQHRLSLLPEPQGQGAQRAMGADGGHDALGAMGAEEDAPALTLGL
jgi:hypothetical protein